MLPVTVAIGPFSTLHSSYTYLATLSLQFVNFSERITLIASIWGLSNVSKFLEGDCRNYGNGREGMCKESGKTWGTNMFVSEKQRKKSLTTTKRGDQGGKKVPAFRLCSTLYKDSPQKSKSAISPAFSYWCCDAPWPTIQTPKNLDSFRAFWYAATTVTRVKPSFTQQSPLEIIMYVWAVVMLSLELIKHVLFSMQLALWSSFSHGRQPLHQKSNKGRRVSV